MVQIKHITRLSALVRRDHNLMLGITNSKLMYEVAERDPGGIKFSTTPEVVSFYPANRSLLECKTVSLNMLNGQH